MCALVFPAGILSRSAGATCHLFSLDKDLLGLYELGLSQCQQRLSLGFPVSQLPLSSVKTVEAGHRVCSVRQAELWKG